MDHTAVLVTGASRGFGRCLALDFVRETPKGNLDVHLWARNEYDLRETERLAHETWQARKQHDANAGTLRTFVVAVDLSDASDYTPKIDAVLAQLRAESTVSKLVLVHNAGSLGELGYTHEWSSYAMLDDYWRFNVLSVLWFNKRFLDVFGASRDELSSVAASTDPTATVAKTPQCLIVNITSLCGLEPFETHGLYCTGKAAREMHHAVVAKEQAPGMRVRVLQYSPGPMDTDMQQTIRESPAVAASLAKMFADMKANGTLIPPETSSRLGVKLALSGAFETGAHVDYYDIAPKQ